MKKAAPPRSRRTRIACALLALLCVVALAGCVPYGFWSPDSKFVATDVDGKLRILSVATGKFATFNSGGRYVANPTFSPNGKMLAYYAATKSKKGYATWNIWLRDLATNKERKLPHTSSVSRDQMNGKIVLTVFAQATKFSPLSWSPDSRKIAHVADINQPITFIQVIDVVDGRITSLPRASQTQRNPVWSPDGRWIAYLTHANTTKRKRKTNNEIDLDPRDFYYVDLCIVDADGTNPRRIRRSGNASVIYPFRSPQWTAKSDALVVLTAPQEPRKFTWLDDVVHEVRLVPIKGRTSRVLTRLPIPHASISSNLQSVVYMGGPKRLTLVHRSRPFKSARVLDRFSTGQNPKSVRGRSASNFSELPVLSPDGKTVAVLPLRNPKTKRLEMRLYDVSTGRKKIYPL